MANVRLQRVAAQMKQIVSKVVTQELKDPRTGFITIVGVNVAPDLKTARVDFSVLGSDAQKRTACRALQSARGYVQARVAEETQIKYTPVISFHLDESIERDIEMQRRIGQIRETDRRTALAKAIRERIAAGSLPPEIVSEVHAAAGSSDFLESIARLLTGLLSVDTTPRPDPAAAAAAERQCFDVLQAALQNACPGEIEAEIIPIDPEIHKDAAYTAPAYAAGPDGKPLPAEQAYAGRGNLLAVLKSSPEVAAETATPAPPLRIALTAHIDTLAPHIPPSRQDDVVRGRGACGAKGQAAMIVATFQLLGRLRDKFGLRLRSDLCAQFVIDKETGGNGSLCLALQDPFPFDAVVVCQATDFRICVACEGAVWYRAELMPPPGRAAELAAWIILALEHETSTIKAESSHPLFPARPVRINHGVLGPFGSAPPSVISRIDVIATSSEPDLEEIRQAAVRGVEKYCQVHGDKTREIDPGTGQPRLAEHFSIERQGDRDIVLHVHGIPGHVSSIETADSAATKAAHVLRELSLIRASGRQVDVALAGHDGNRLVIEGALSFLPTHRIADIRARLTLAARHGVTEFGTQAGLKGNAAHVEMSFDRLHNDAFAREPDSALAVYAVESARRAGLDATAPAALDDNCDARLFADVFHHRDVVVFGPGHVPLAHSPEETISLRDIASGAKMLAFLVLDATGVAGPSR